MLKAALHADANVSESSSSLIKQAGIVIGASAVIAVCARLVLPLPFTPVPLTLANFGVLLIGLTPVSYTHLCLFRSPYRFH